MDAEENSILAKKIKRSNFDLSAFPVLDALSIKLVQLAISTTAELSNELLDYSIARTTMQDRQLLQSEVAADAYFYRLKGHYESDFVLIELKTKFLASISQSLLGSAFSIADDASPTELDFALAGIFIDKFIEQMNARDLTALDDNPFNRLTPLFRDTDGSDLFENESSASFLSLQLDIANEAGNCPAFVIHFPLEFVEKAGLLEQAPPRSETQGDETKWRTIMKANVAATKIDLGIVLDRFEMALSAFPQLKVGDAIPLSKYDRTVDINLRTTDGELTIGKGILGAAQNHKAVKLLELKNLDKESDAGAAF